MKRAELNKLFTAYVVRYTTLGYTIFTEGMSGHQGEIAKILLKKNDDLKIILMEETWGGSEDNYMDFIQIRIGTYTKKIPVSDSPTIWLQDFDYFVTDKFYLIGKKKYRNPEANWYGTFEEAKAAVEKGLERYSLREISEEHLLNKVPESIKNHIRTLWGYKRVKDSEIKVEVKNDKFNHGYYVYAKDKLVFTNNFKS